MVDAAWLMSKQRLDRIRRRVVAAALGYGLLLLHVGIFLIAATGLLLIDLYRHPAGPTVSGLLRTWAAIIVFHAVAITGYRVARWGLGLSAEETADAQPVHAQATPLVHLAGRMLGKGVTWARLRANVSVADMRAFASRDLQTAHTVWKSVSVQMRSMTVYWERLTTGEYLQPPSTTATSTNGWSQPHANGLATVKGHDLVDVAAPGSQGNGANPPWPSSWPERKPHSGGSASTPTNGNGVIHHNGGADSDVRYELWQRPGPAVDSSRPANRAAPTSHGFTPPEPLDGSTPMFDPLTAASMAPGDFPVGVVAGNGSASARWSWMEAAAAAWLSQREIVAPPAEAPSQGRADPRPPAISPAPPNEPDAAASG